MDQEQEIVNKKKPVEFPEQPEGFDNRTHIRDAKTGRLIRVQGYAIHDNGGEKMFERPVNSGNMFNHAGHSLGKWTSKIVGKNTIWAKVSDKHDDVPAYTMLATKEEFLEAQNDDLKKELAALQAELEAKAISQKEPHKK